MNKIRRFGFLVTIRNFRRAPVPGKFWIVDWIKYGGQQQGQVPVSQVEKIKEKKIYKGKTLVKDVGKYNFCIEFLGTHYTGWKKVFKAIP